MENWKDIKGFEGIYQISNEGRVKSLDRYCWNGTGYFFKTGQIIKTRILPNGYERVSLKRKSFYIHRLVAMAFLPNPQKLPQVNHKDEVKTNNNVENLEWCTEKYNTNYGTARERQKAKIVGVTINNKPIKQYDKSGRLIAVFKSALEAAKTTKINNSFVCKAANGKYKTAGGYVWGWC